MSVSCGCCVLSGRGLCDGLITRPEESYRLWCVSSVRDHETSTKRGGPGPYRAVEPYKKKYIYIYIHISCKITPQQKESTLAKTSDFCALYSLEIQKWTSLNEFTQSRIQLVQHWKINIMTQNTYTARQFTQHRIDVQFGLIYTKQIVPKMTVP
jgi:hypothetical protein